MLQPIGLLTLFAGVLGLLYGPTPIMRCLIPMSLLGAAGAIILPGSGTIQPAHLLLGFVAPIVVSRARETDAILRSLRFPNEGFWLLWLAIYALAGAMILPRLLAGATLVHPVGISEYGDSPDVVPLGPTSANYTQSIYMLANVMCFICVVGYGHSVQRVRTLAQALLVYGFVNIAFAILDIATYWTGTGYLLDFIRNGQYTLHLEEASGALKRIAGSFTETSSFSYATIGALGFTLRLWIDGVWTRAASIAALVSLVLLLISTSTTALIAVTGLLLFVFACEIWRVARGRSTPNGTRFVVAFPMSLILATIWLFLDTDQLNALIDYFSFTLLDKSTSQSGLQRAGWNAAAMQNIIDTMGIGGGLGSMRASSFPLALLSNLGLIGGLLFGPFLARVFGARHADPTSGVAATRYAARTACVGLMLGALVSGTLVDLSLVFYIYAGVACVAIPQADVRPLSRGASEVLPRVPVVPHA